MYKNKKAFTLAELLVAMFIFSIIAVMLVPNVMQSSEKNLFVTQTKKVYNDLQQAVLLIISKNSGTLQAFCSGGNSNQCFIDELVGKAGNISGNTPEVKGYLEKRVVFSSDVSKNTCNNESEAKDPCRQREMFIDKKPQYMNKTPANLAAHQTNNFYAANLTTGATVSVVYSSACSSGISGESGDASLPAPANTDICGYMEVDVNASKAPNMIGKDIHLFWIVDGDGLVPFGEIDNYPCHPIKTNRGNIDQLGCTYKVIEQGKMTYY